jgi:hypothetical protein
MTDDFYKKAFKSALLELSALTKQRNEVKEQLDELDERIEKVRQGAIGLTSLANLDFQEVKGKYPDLFEDQIDQRMGITDAVRAVLSSSADDMLTPTEIRDRVFQLSPGIAGHKNPLASIHAVIRRLIDKNEVLYGVDGLERTVYGWIGSDDWKERISTWNFKNADEVIERIEKEKGKRK